MLLCLPATLLLPGYGFFVVGFFVDLHVPLTYTFTNAICYLFKAFVKKKFRDVSGNV